MIVPGFYVANIKKRVVPHRKRHRRDNKSATITIIYNKFSILLSTVLGFTPSLHTESELFFILFVFFIRYQFNFKIFSPPVLLFTLKRAQNRKKRPSNAVEIEIDFSVIKSI